MKRLFGRFVLFILIIVALAYVWNHYSGAKGGCSVASGAVGVAHADTTACPAHIVRAAGDSSWAAGQQRTMRFERITTGRYITNRVADPQSITSGWNTPPGISDRIVDLLHDSPNYPNFPRMCDGVMGCKTAVAAILPEGSLLSVWELGASRSIEVTGEATS